MNTTTLVPDQPAGARLQGCTNFKLRQLTRRITQHYDAELARVGLRTTQYSLLSHVLKLGPVQPGALAQAMKMEASTLTRNLKPLLAAGWVLIAPGVDGRSRQVTLTPAGKDKRQQAQQQWRAAQTRLNHLLGMERVSALHQLIDESLELLAPGDEGASHD